MDRSGSSYRVKGLLFKDESFQLTPFHLLNSLFKKKFLSYVPVVLNWNIYIH